ncbi:MAG: GAF domain-containing protein [Armatimonadota bacterium]
MKALQVLHDKLDFGLWMITRVEGHDWVVLKSKDFDYGVQDGDVFVWLESFCCRMIRGEGPNFAPVSKKVTAYAQAEIGKKVPIQAYIGFPMWGENGELLGTLCAIDPNPVPESWSEFEPFVQQIANELAEAYRADYHQTIQNGQERLSNAKSEDQVGELLALDWESLLEAHQLAAQQKEKPYSIIVIKIDASLRKDQEVAGLLQTIVGNDNFVVYQGDHLYAILLQDCNTPGLEGIAYLLRSSLLELGVKALIGNAIHNASIDLNDTYDIAIGKIVGEELRTRAAQVKLRYPRLIKSFFANLLTQFRLLKADQIPTQVDQTILKSGPQFSTLQAPSSLPHQSPLRRTLIDLGALHSKELPLAWSCNR